jgi:signal transduction histidine kinase/CheY-like chemotaxis protein
MIAVNDYIRNFYNPVRRHSTNDFLSPLEMEGERLVVSAIRDVTARVRLEEQRAQLEAQLRQSQKMDSLGVLSAGIAHDFNNLLAVIAGGTELALDHATPADPITGHLMRVAQAASRASELVNQILTFGRANPARHVPVSLRSVVDEAVAMLRATVPASIGIVTAIDSEVPVVVGDPTQIHQVLMNLGTNAWHAIEDTKGTITVRLGGVLVGPADADAIGVPPGAFSRIQVSDDGVGMDATTSGRVFEPFFTTKDPGKGIGLGLAVAYGIIADHGGAITVESAKGLGTTCSVYLPQAGPEPALLIPTIALSRPHGSARVLVVDDEELVGVVFGALLEGLGYTVTLCQRSTEALDQIRANPGGFEILITDQSMPVMGGVELARNVAALRPDLPIILTSGYRHHSDDELKGANIRSFLRKPFTAVSVRAAIALALRQ